MAQGSEAKSPTRPRKAKQTIKHFSRFIRFFPRGIFSTMSGATSRRLNWLQTFASSQSWRFIFDPEGKIIAVNYWRLHRAETSWNVERCATVENFPVDLLRLIMWSDVSFNQNIFHLLKHQRKPRAIQRHKFHRFCAHITQVTEVISGSNFSMYSMLFMAFREAAGGLTLG